MNSIRFTEQALWKALENEAKGSSIIWFPNVFNLKMPANRFIRLSSTVGGFLFIKFPSSNSTKVTELTEVIPCVNQVPPRGLQLKENVRMPVRSMLDYFATGSLPSRSSSSVRVKQSQIFVAKLVERAFEEIDLSSLAELEDHAQFMELIGEKHAKYITILSRVT